MNIKPRSASLRSRKISNGDDILVYQKYGAEHQVKRLKFASTVASDRSTRKQTSKAITANTKKPKKSKKQYICKFCSKEFLGISDLAKHNLTHTGEKPFACGQCNKSYRQAIGLKNHVASIHGTNHPFTCEICSKTFPIKERLRLHMRIHTGEKPYNCPLCPKQFARGGQVRQHLVLHDGVKAFKCETCPRSFSTAGNLRMHVKSHLDQLEFVCNICAKRFNRKDALRRHLDCYHSGRKTFHCNVCNKILKGHLSQHMRLHDNIRPHICEICNTTFSQKSQLNVHKRMHTGERPYQCEVCWQAFAHSSVLKLHIRKHTGEKPFKCLICVDKGTAFSQLPHLKNHMKAIHQKENPYMCQVCQQFFKTKNKLYLHERECAVTEEAGPKFPGKETQLVETERSNALSKLRLNVTVLLKKISTSERLEKLGFEKRLIDNVIVSALKIAGKKFCEDEVLDEVDRLKFNIGAFLEWTIPKEFMDKFRKEEKSIDILLEDLCYVYKKFPVE